MLKELEGVDQMLIDTKIRLCLVLSAADAYEFRQWCDSLKLCVNRVTECVKIWHGDG